MAERLDVLLVYASFEEPLAEAELQAVHLATPNRIHFEQASQTLQASPKGRFFLSLTVISCQFSFLLRLVATTRCLAVEIESRRVCDG